MRNNCVKDFGSLQLFATDPEEVEFVSVESDDIHCRSQCQRHGPGSGRTRTWEMAEPSLSGAVHQLSIVSHVVNCPSSIISPAIALSMGLFVICNRVVQHTCVLRYILNKSAYTPPVSIILDSLKESKLRYCSRFV